MIRSPAGFDGGDRIKRYLDYYQPSYGVTMLSAGQFSPASLFAAGEQGFWYDPSDFSTMFQDAAGTTPVTAVEQPVGLILDKSGRNNHASQATLISRPILKQDANSKYYLLFDGSNDNLSTSSINFGVTNKMTLFAGVRKLSDAALGVVLEAAPNYTTAGGIGVFAPDGAASARYAFAMTGATGAQFDSTPASYAAPVTSVLQSSMDISQLGYAGLTARVNGAAVALSYTGAGVTSTGNFGNYVVHIGRRGGSSSPFNGHLYSLIVRGAQSTNAQITNTETWVNGKTGAY